VPDPATLGAARIWLAEPQGPGDDIPGDVFNRTIVDERMRPQPDQRLGDAEAACTEVMPPRYGPRNGNQRSPPVPRLPCRKVRLLAVPAPGAGRIICWPDDVEVIRPVPLARPLDCRHEFANEPGVNRRRVYGRITWADAITSKIPVIPASPDIPSEAVHIVLDLPVSHLVSRHAAIAPDLKGRQELVIHE
jgi:hypothetical protein